MVNLAVRVYQAGVLQSTKLLAIDDDAIESVIPSLAMEHAEMCMSMATPTMIELEFLDEPAVNQRFFRIGTDPNGMVLPMRIG